MMLVERSEYGFEKQKIPTTTKQTRQRESWTKERGEGRGGERGKWEEREADGKGEMKSEEGVRIGKEEKTNERLILCLFSFLNNLCIVWQKKVK